ncbi:response regulator [Bradyrhizobium sp. Arg816]|uniref:response regulator n=1 Tax=Bradyrhizobium sp. Arg816 TaxID=2998491 RepID=UPI00249F6C35|nr:response regulator [Bradyrhizobium sp. Arg816]MDI3560622.1 response regulator [Bradyrhizobium sp. Arg816]
MSGRRLQALVVEDEMTIALMIEDMLTDLGHQVVAMAMRLPQALELAKTSEIDFVVLDVNLDGHMSFAVADALIERGVPFVFVTGYGAAGVDPKYRHQGIVLQKPFDLADLEKAIERLPPR